MKITYYHHLLSNDSLLTFHSSKPPLNEDDIIDLTNTYYTRECKKIK